MCIRDSLYIGEDPAVTISSVSAASGLKSNLNFEGQFSWQAVIVILTLSTIILLVLWSFVSWLWRLPGRFKTGQGLRRGARAIDAIEEALLAGAEGDASKARKKAAQAQSLIKSPALGHLIRAQTAEAVGDIDETVNHYKALLKVNDKRVQMVAEKGLVRQFMANGQLADVIAKAGATFKDDKNARWAFDPLFRAHAMNGNWQEAIDILAAASKRGFVDKDAARRRRAVLMTAEAQRILRVEDQGQAANRTKMRDLALKVASESPDFAPGAALAAQILTEQGEEKQAAKLIEKAWAKAPHPALSLAYRDIYSDKSAKEKMKRYASLIKQNPSHRESHILEIEAALQASDYVQAWSALSPLVTDNPTARLCALAAQAEDGLNNPADARMWLERGLSAPSEADWSDLDPEGKGFDYTVRDWQRLVFTFGDTGELIHPRLETGAAKKRLSPETSPETPSDSAPKIIEAEPKEESQNPAEEPGLDRNLADRLDSLLDKDPKS